MKAAVYYQTGTPDVLKYEDVADPPCHASGVVIRVEAVSIEGGDTLNRGGGAMAGSPHIVGYQAAGSAPFMRGAAVRNPETVATAIRIGDPQSWDLAWAVQQESGGWFDECTDEDILRTQRRLAELDGVFCEPASAASLCGAIRDIKSGKIAPGSKVVCTLTGFGLKDPDIIVKGGLSGVVEVDAERSAVEKALLDRLS